MPQYQPIDYARGSGQVDPLQVARQYQGLQSDKLINQQNQLKLQQQQQAPARLDAFKMGLQQLDRTDPKAVANFNVQFPEFAEQTQAIVTGQQEQTQKAYDFKSQQEKDLVKDASGKLLQVGMLGKPELLDQAIDQLADVIGNTGDPSMTPEVMKQRARENPEQFIQGMAGVYNASGGKAADYGYKQEKPTLKKMGTGAMSGYIYDQESGQYSITPEIEEHLKIKAEEKAEEARIRSGRDKGKLKLSDQRGIQSDVTNMVKDATNIKKSAKRLRRLKEVDNPAAQVAIIFDYMKALDPDSVVREGEQGLVASASGPAEKIAALINKASGQGPLTSEVIDDIILTSETLADEAINSSEETVNKYLNAYGNSLPEGFRQRLYKRIPTALKPTPTKKKDVVIKPFTPDSATVQTAIHQPSEQTEESRLAVDAALAKYAPTQP